MSDNLPVPVGVPPNETLLAALAMAAARVAVEQARAPAEAPIGRDEAEAIARAAVVEAFKQFGVDLDSVASVEAHRSVIAHARRSREMWAKATHTVWSGIWSALTLAGIAAFTWWASLGRGK